MNLAVFLANRILRSSGNQKSVSKPVVYIAVTGIALGISAMLLSVMIVTGFRDEIAAKVTGFMGDVRINRYDANETFEEVPLPAEPDFLFALRSTEQIHHVQAYANKAAILKAKEDISGVILKGVDAQFNWEYFRDKLVEGKLPLYTDSLSNAALISANVASKLRLKTGDSFLVYFIQKDRKIRKLTVSGIYRTGLSEEFDDLYVMCDLNLVRQVNNWKNKEAGGFEVFLHKGSRLDETSQEIHRLTGFEYNTRTIRELYPQMYNWLDLQNLNVIVIITLITFVAGITMISTLLILVLENSRQIGLLKSMGAANNLITKTYAHVSLRILLRGMFAGNVIGIGLAFLQSKYGFFTLPEESYYISKVPVSFHVTGIVMINLITFICCALMLLIPSSVIARINPVKVLRFD